MGSYFDVTRKKDSMRGEEYQLDSTEWFIALICPTCFRHFYAHHQELETICVLLPPIVCNVLVAGGRRSGAGSRLAFGMRDVARHSPATSLIPDA